MTHQQYPIGRGFTAASTADEVLACIDLSSSSTADGPRTGSAATPSIQASVRP